MAEPSGAVAELRRGEANLSFTERIAAVGLNFQFKTAFHLHDDAVPPGRGACTDREHLCPRCALFGMVAEDGGKDGGAGAREGGGLRGRFTAATLVGPAVTPGMPVEKTYAGGRVFLRRWSAWLKPSVWAA